MTEMIVDHDPGDEHRGPWPFYCSAEPFDVSASDDMVVVWSASTPIGNGWYTAVAEIDRSKGTRVIVYADGRVEDISSAFDRRS